MKKKKSYDGADESTASNAMVEKMRQN